MTNVELLPPAVKEERLSLTGLLKAADSLAETELRMQDSIQFIKTTTIKTAEDSRKMKEAVAALKPQMKTASVYFTPFTSALDAASKSLKQLVQRVVNAGEEAKGLADKKISDWERAEAAAAQKEQEEKQKKVDDENRRLAEEQRKKDEAAAKERKTARIAEIREQLKSKQITKRQAEKLLVEAGAQEEADKARAAADEEDRKANAPKVEVKPNIAKVAGTVSRKNYSGECVNPGLMLADFARRFVENRLVETVEAVDHNGEVTKTEINWLRLVCVDRVEINALARSIKNVEALEKALPHVKGEVKATY